MCTRAPVLTCTRAPVHMCTRARVHMCTRARVRMCTRAPVLPCSRAPVLPCSRAPVLPCMSSGCCAVFHCLWQWCAPFRRRKNSYLHENWADFQFRNFYYFFMLWELQENYVSWCGGFAFWVVNFWMLRSRAWFFNFLQKKSLQAEIEASHPV